MANAKDKAKEKAAAEAKAKAEKAAAEKEPTVKNAEGKAKVVKSKDELEKLMVEQCYGLADGSVASIQQILAYAKKAASLK